MLASLALASLARSAMRCPAPHLPSLASDRPGYLDRCPFDASVGIPPVCADCIVSPMPAVASDDMSAIAEGAITISGVHPEACSSLPRPRCACKAPIATLLPANQNPQELMSCPKQARVTNHHLPGTDALRSRAPHLPAPQAEPQAFQTLRLKECPPTQPIAGPGLAHPRTHPT